MTFALKLTILMTGVILMFSYMKLHIQMKIWML